MTALAEIPTATGGTVFQREVWKALRRDSRRHDDQLWTARREHWAYWRMPRSGAANGANPIAIVVPCHRVIGADGTLTGFASGLSRKKWLLDHEARFAPVAAGV